VKVSEPAMIAAAKDELLKALACVDEFLALHGAGDGDYAVGPHYGWSMSSQGGDEKVRLPGWGVCAVVCAVVCARACGSVWLAVGCVCWLHQTAAATSMC
jgi:hypothetical protein